MVKRSAEADSRRKKYLKNLINKNPKDIKFAVLAAGHGGLAMAGHLAIMGFKVNLYNRGRYKILPVKERGSIKVEGEVEGIGKINVASNKMEECIKGVDVIMVAVPAFGHRFMAETCAPYLRENQIVVLNPGRTLGALEFFQVLKEKGLKTVPFIAEAQTFIYASRALGPAHAKIFGIKSWKLFGFLFTYTIFTTILFFILNFKYPLNLFKVFLITSLLLILGAIIKKWLK